MIRFNSRRLLLFIGLILLLSITGYYVIKDQLSKRSEVQKLENRILEQEKSLEELNIFKFQQEQAEKEKEELNKKEEEKRIEIENCQAIKLTCSKKLSEASKVIYKKDDGTTIGNKTSAENDIAYYKRLISDWEKSDWDGASKAIKDANNLINSIQKAIAVSETNKNALLSGECGSYTTPCE